MEASSKVVETVLFNERITEKVIEDQCITFKGHSIERHVSTSEDEPKLMKKNGYESERGHEGKRIPPPKNVQPVVSGNNKITCHI